MNGATIQQKIWLGYGKAAGYIGQSYAQYRATGANSPTGALVNPSLMVSLNAEDMTYAKPRGYAKATWYALLDGTNALVGDYLVGGDTYFIASMEPLLPILAVKCNRTLTFARPEATQAFGAIQGYEGNTAANETILATGWPASVLAGTKGEKDEVDLPGDVRTPWWLILVPAMPGITLNTSYLITDDLGRRYVISSAELTAHGWKLTAQQAKT